MKLSNTYHHYKGYSLSRSERIERYIVEEIVNSELSDDERESSRAWELMHSSTCKAFMHVLAEKRGLDYELSRVAGAVHDFYVIKTGKYKNHARKGVPLVAEILANQGDFSDQEIQLVLDMVGNHSDKDIYSDNPYVELIKDADVFDCSLYPGTEAYYLAKKSFPVCFEYFQRMAMVREELGMPPRIAFETLEALNEGRRSELGEVVSVDGSLCPISTFFAMRSMLRAFPKGALSAVHIHHHDGTAAWTCYLRHDLAANSLGEAKSDIANLAPVLNQLVLGGDLSSARSLKELEIVFARCMDRLWVGSFDTPRLRNEAAKIFQEYECDPNSDDVFAELTERGVHKSIQESGASDQLFGLLNPQEIGGGGSAAQRWELDEDQEVALNNWAAEVMRARLRGLCVKALEIELERIKALEPDKYDGYLPKELVSGEVHLHETGGPDVWSLIAWPLFGSCELLTGEEAVQRQLAVDSYKNKRCCN